MNPETKPAANQINSANITPPSTISRKAFLAIQIIIIIIQIIFLLLHLSKHGYVHKTGEPLNGYQMGKNLTVFSALFISAIAVINIISRETNKKLQTLFIIIYLFSLPLLFIDILSYTCFDTCSQYVKQSSFGSVLACILYLATFPFIIASRIAAGRIQKTQAYFISQTKTS